MSEGTIETIINKKEDKHKLNSIKRLDSFQCFQLMDSLALKYDTLMLSGNFSPMHVSENLKDFISINDIIIIRSVGLGAQGEIFLCQLSESYLNNIYLKKTGLKSFNNILALKVMGKEEISKNMHRSFFEIEREILCKSLNSNWLLGMHASFQDEYNIYFLTDYLSGGDLFTLFEQIGEFNIELIRFYAACTVLALEELHGMGFIHRDIKPDNILIDSFGYIKLADFGSSIKNKDKILNTGVPIGTPDYISIEVLNLQQKYKEYDENCDLWSLGVMLYELWYDELPFNHENLTETYKKINSIQYCFPNNNPLRIMPIELKRLIENLIIEPEKRLNIQEIKKHEFFKEIDFNTLRYESPPFIPPSIDMFKDKNCFIKKKQTNSHNQFLGFSYDPIVLEEVIIENQFIAPSNRRTTIGKKSVSIINNIQINEKENIKNEVKRLEEKQYELNETLLKLQEIIKKQEDYKKEIENKIEDSKNLIEDLNLQEEKIKNEIESKKIEKNLIDLNNKEVIEGEGEDIKEIKKEKERYKIMLSKMINVLKSNALCNLKLQERIKGIEEEIKIIENSFEILISFMKNSNKSTNTKDNKKNREEVSNLLLKVDQLEIYIKSLETELSKYKNLNDKLQKVKASNLEFNIKIQIIIKNKEYLNSYKSIEREVKSILKIDKENIKINKLTHPLTNVLIKDLSEYEITSIRGLDRNSLKFILLADSVKNIKFSRNKRIDISSLKNNINNKKKMYESFCNLKINNKESLKQFDIQKNNLLSQIKILEKEYKLALKNSDISNEKDLIEEECIHEFKNHIFKKHKFSDVVLCAFCSKALTNNAGYECKFCKMTTHEGCFSSVRESCEFYQALSKGLTIYINTYNQTDKEALFAMFEKS